MNRVPFTSALVSNSNSITSAVHSIIIMSSILYGSGISEFNRMIGEISNICPLLVNAMLKMIIFLLEVSEYSEYYILLAVNQVQHLPNSAIFRFQWDLFKSVRALEVDRFSTGGHHQRIGQVASQFVASQRHKACNRFAQVLFQNPINHDAILKIQGSIHTAAVQLLHGIIDLDLVNQDLVHRASITLDVIVAIHLTNFSKRVP